MMKLKTALSALTIAAALAVITTACSNEELFLEQQPVAKAPVYHFSLPASIGGDADTRVLEFGSDGTSITSRFTAEDKIYAFLVRDGVSPIPETAVAYNGKEGAEAAVEPILPTAISDDGMSCTLSGDLKFLATPIAFMSETPPENSPTAPEVGDRILFCYGMSTTSMLGPLYVGCNYGEGTQDGTATGVGAFNIAKATMVVTGVSGNDEDGYSLTLVQEDDDTKSNIHFENIGSMFRQRLTFTPGENPGEGSANPTIWGLKLETAKGSFNDFFFPSLFPIPFPSSDMAALVMPVPDYTPTPVSLIIRNAQGLLDAQGDVYFAALFNEGLSDGDDALTLTATDFDGNVYTATKSAPSTGFKNSKYYYGTTNLVWKEKLVLPCIIDNKTDLRCLPDISKNEFTFDDAADITISSVSEDYTVDLRKGGTVTFDNFTASNSQKFLESGNGTLNVVLTGDNNFTVSDGGQCILSSVTEDLRLSCTGFSATLTVKVKNSLYCGLCGKNYYYDNNDHLNSAEVDVSTQLAAPGFSVIRSARVDGPISDPEEGPDYYTWTYTISQKTLAQATTADVGKIVGADGRIYNDFDDIFSAGIPARAMVAFVGAVDGVCEHGLAISLMDAYNYQTTWSGAQDVAISEWVATHPVVGGTWRLPSFKDWQYMLWGYYVESPEETDISGFNTKLGNAGGYKLADGSGAYFWTSTSVDDDNAKLLYYDGSQWSSFSDSSKDGYWHIRACLAF